MGKKPIKSMILHLARIAAVVTITASSISCTTTYDAYGRPVQSVDPGAAAAGVAAAGVVGYAIGRNRGDEHHHYHSAPRRPAYHGRRGHHRRW